MASWGRTNIYTILIAACLKSQKKFWSVRLGKILEIILQVQSPYFGNGETDLEKSIDTSKSNEG